MNGVELFLVGMDVRRGRVELTVMTFVFFAVVFMVGIEMVPDRWREQ